MSLQAQNIVDYPEISYDMMENYLAKRYEQQILNSSSIPEVEIHLILARNCNLNCTNCQAGCRIDDKDDFMTLDEIKYALPKLKNFFQNSIIQVVLFGGEPLLNPEYKEICKYIRNELPNTTITIYTNGIIISNWEKNDYQFAIDLNIHFIYSLYPLPDYLDKMKHQEEIMSELNIQHQCCGNRPFFVKGAYNTEGTSNPNRFFTCCHSLYPPHIYLFKKKLWRCAPSLSWDKINIPCFDEDYLDIDNLNEKQFLEYCSKPLHICKFCGEGDNLPFGSDEIIVWHSQKDLPSNYSDSLIDLYINNYDKYYEYIHNCKNIITCLNNEYFLNANKPDELPSNPFKLFLNRFKVGLGDVCIPFTKESCQNIENLFKLKELILNQTDYSKINFYFISLDKNKMAKQHIYNIFPPSSCDLPGNIFLLESDTPNNFYQIFLQNSYLKKKICILNYKDLLDKNYLSNKFNEMDG